MFLALPSACHVRKRRCALQSEALASSAVRASKKLAATLILAFTKTGRTAGLLAKYRAAVPILTVCLSRECSCASQHDATAFAKMWLHVQLPEKVERSAHSGCRRGGPCSATTTGWLCKKSPQQHMTHTRQRALQVIAKGDGKDAEVAKARIARQTAALRAVIPFLAPQTSSGPMATDGSLTDWAVKEVRSPSHAHCLIALELAIQESRESCPC